MNEQTGCAAWLVDNNNERVLIEGTCSIGRALSNHLVLGDQRVSRRHAIVHAQGEHEYWLVDLGSSNGTYVNGRRISQPVQLRDRDAIQVGPFVVTFRQPAQEGVSPTRTVSCQTLIDVRSNDCWLLVADIEGSTRLAEQLSPEELPVVIGSWFSDCKQELETNGGLINKYLGDGFFAYWLASPPVAESLLAALRGLRQLQQRAQPRFRLVLHHGRVVMGGGVSPGEENLSGREVNFVFRMEKLAGSLLQPRLMSEAAQSLLQGRLELAEVGAHPLPGFEGEYRFFAF